MTCYLVTGGAGFLGAEVVRALASRGDRVIAFDVVTTPALLRVAEAHKQVVPVVGEITEWPRLAEVFRDHGPQGVVHCAAVVGVVHSLAAPLRTMEVNVGGSLNLFEAMRLHGVKRVIHISSEETYGPFQAPKADESHPQNPLHPYGVSKLAVEHLGRGYGNRYGLECINLRTCWVYGPGLPRPRIPKNLVDAALAGRPMHLPAGRDFAVDHTHVSDVVTAILAALDLERHPHDAYNVGSGEAASLSQIIAIIQSLVPGAELSAGPGNYEFAPGIPAVKKGALDISRAREVLGYRPRYDIRAGLAEYVEAGRRQG